MRAAVFHAPGDVRIEQVAEPSPPGPGELLIRVAKAALCGTDSAEWAHGPLLAQPPVVLGHEFTGEVVAAGPGVGQFPAGTRVVSGSGISCGTCDWCAAGRTNLCATYQTLGLHRDGGLAELVLSPAAICEAVPAELDDIGAAMAQPLVKKVLKKRMASELVRRLGANESLFWGGAVVFDETIKQSVLSPEMLGRYNGLSTYNVVRQHQETIAAARPNADFAARMTYLELKLRLPELLLMRVDKITMATSVEARVPFLDHHLIEYAMGLPRNLKVRGASGKHILKRALESVLPADVLYKPKRGFGAPTREWFRGPESKSLVKQLMNSSIRERNFFDYSFIQHLADEHAREAHDWSANLWCLLNLSLWYDHWIAGKAN